jgi:hypothetical protein
MKKQSAIKRIWAWLAGNKTIIVLGSWMLLTKLNELGIISIPENYMELINWVHGILTTGSLTDHIRKGYFTTKKGV